MYVFSLLTAAILVSQVTAYANSALLNAGPVVDLAYSRFVGNETLPGVAFYGAIPYARPPLGNLRWRSPQQLDERHIAETDRPVYDARNFGQICIQQPAVVGIGSEDCVTLNIWKPTNATKDSKLPVVVYIHGGGNYYNSAQGFPMGDWVTTADYQIIAVSVQYRLGLFGFLASDAVKADGSVNVGLQDQRAALEWLTRHSTAFGGDPENITISGESSGGGSVLNHLIWQGGEDSPPFQRAILQSIGNDPVPTPEVYEQCFGNVTKVVGCDQAQDVMACLRSTALSALVTAINRRPQPLCKYLPMIDGTHIRGIPSQEFSAGRFSKVPVLSGHTTDDGSIFTGSAETVKNDTALYAALTTSRYTRLTYETFQRARALYPLSEFESYYDMAKTLVGDTQFTCYDWFVAKQTAKYGQPSFNYRWNTPDPVQFASSPSTGVRHTSDLYFLFDGTNSGVSSSNAQNVFRAFNATEQRLATEAVSYWTSFARSSSPSTFKPSDSPEWPELSPRDQKGAQRIVLQIGNSGQTGSLVETLSERYIERCLFWVSVSNETRV